MSSSKNNWPIGFDAKLIGYKTIGVLLFLAIMQIVVSLSTDVYSGVIANNEAFRLSIYLLLEVKLPLIMIVLVILLFSQDFNSRTYQYTISLPVKRWKLIVFRFLRLLLIYTIYFILLFLIYRYKINKELISHNVKQIGLFSGFFMTYTVSLFVGSFSLLATILLKRKTYIFTLCLGYWTFEYFSMGVLTRKLQLFICYTSNYDYNTIIMNRIILLIMSIIFLFISVKIVGSKFYVLMDHK